MITRLFLFLCFVIVVSDDRTAEAETENGFDKHI